MTVWALDRVLALAPDAGSVTAARRLGEARWTGLGSSARAVWGHCQGSGPRPYTTVVDVRSDPASRCTCPSRKQPCKHSLALMILWSIGRIPDVQSEAPYATDWVEGRAARQDARADQQTPTTDPDAAAQRARVRAERVASGLEELERWLTDQVGGGLSGLERRGYAHFDAIAARMIDAQAPGVASALRAIPADLVGESWPERVLAQLAGLHLLVRAHRHLDVLPEGLAATVRSRVGYQVAKDQVRATPPVRDSWLALGLVDTVEFQLETRRVWLLGLSTGRWGMVLSFAAPGQPLEASVLPGQVVEGDLHFYPGSGQHRVLVGEHVVVESSAARQGEDVATLRDRFAALVADDPWCTRMPTLIRGCALAPSSVGQAWRLQDGAGSAVELERLTDDPWPLLAHTTGRPADVFGEWNGRSLRPLSVLVEGRVDTRVTV